MKETEEARERKWEVRMDHTLPMDIVVSSQRPDLVCVDHVGRIVVLGELTVPWEEAISEAHERKLRRYEELAQEVRERGWGCEVNPFEVGVRGFRAASVKKLLRRTRVVQQRKVAKEMEQKAEEGSMWILKTWAQHQ